MAKKSNSMRADGRIAVQVYLGRVDGKRKYKTVYGATQKEADQKAQELKVQINKGIDLNVKDDSFSFWAEKFLMAKKNEATQSQYKLYKSRVSYFTNTLGKKSLSKIKLYELQEIIDELSKNNPYTKKPTAKKTLTDYTAIVKNIFEYAIANRIIEFNPAKYLSVPSNAPKSTRNSLTQEQINWVIDTPHRAQTAAMIMMFAGLRRGELAALLWSDIDLKQKTISVSKSYDFKNKVLKGTKTLFGTRVVYIPNNLVGYLKGLKKTSLFVFPSTSGNMMDKEPSWQRLWTFYNKALNKKYGDFKKIKIPDKRKALPIVIDTFTPHQLRHTYCTLLYEAGIDVVTAKELMGHKDIKTTLGIYTHLSKEKSEKDIKKLNKFLLNKSNASQVQVSNKQKA